jgi:hypothetical protein
MAKKYFPKLFGLYRFLNKTPLVTFFPANYIYSRINSLLLNLTLYALQSQLAALVGNSK